MKKLKLIYIIFAVILIGCSGTNKITRFVKEGGLETKGLVNLALASSGSMVSVSQDNSDHPASTMINGVTSSENWDQGEGWETEYSGQFARGEYVGYGVEDPMVVTERLRNSNRDEETDPSDRFDAGDPSWRGLRTQTRYGDVDTAMGWVVIEFPDEKIVNRAVIYTVDSEKYPADRFGVADLMLQHWSKSAKSWAVVERIGKVKSQADNEIHDNKNSQIIIRFQPVETSRMRLVIRWTNDSKSNKRGYYQYVTGIIRLAEIEIYGYEKESINQTESASVAQDANKIAEVEVVIGNYIDGYNKKDVNILMSSISSSYSKDGEKYQDFKKKMESIFEKYRSVKIELNDTRTKLTEEGATVTSNYMARYGAAEGSSQTTASGVLVFTLSRATGYWKITRLDTQ